MFFFSFSEEKKERNQNYILPFAFAINMVLIYMYLLLVKPTTVNFLRLFAVCGRARSFLRLLADNILNSLRLELLALKAQFNFFLPLACSCGARTSCATSCARIISGLYCSALATNLWQEHFKMYELSEIMRQKDDREFAELLNRLREGKQTEQDIEVLKGRILKIKPGESDYPMNITHLFSTNQAVDGHNVKISKYYLTPKTRKQTFVRLTL